MLKLPSNMTIKQLVLLLAKQYKLKPLFIKLYTYANSQKARSDGGIEV